MVESNVNGILTTRNRDTLDCLLFDPNYITHKKENVGVSLRKHK